MIKFTKLSQAIVALVLLVLSISNPITTNKVNAEGQITIDYSYLNDVIPEEIKPAINTALMTFPIQLTNPIYVLSARVENKWALLSATYENMQTIQANSLDDNGAVIPKNTFNIIVVFTNSGWVAAHSLDASASSLLIQIPEEPINDDDTNFLESDAKQILFPTVDTRSLTTIESNTTVVYKFPWPANNTWKISQTWHEGSSLDFITSSSDKRIIAAAEGTVTGIKNCNIDDQSWLTIKDGNGAVITYIHIKYSDLAVRKIGLGSKIKLGQELGSVVNVSTTKNNCAYGAANHVHINFPAIPFIIDGKALFSDVNLYQSFTSTNNVYIPFTNVNMINQYFTGAPLSAFGQEYGFLWSFTKNAVFMYAYTGFPPNNPCNAQTATMSVNMPVFGHATTIKFNNLLYQTVRKNGTKEIYVRYSADAQNWSNWQLIESNASSSPAAIVYDNKLYLGYVNRSRQIKVTNLLPNVLNQWSTPITVGTSVINPNSDVVFYIYNGNLYLSDILEDHSLITARNVGGVWSTGFNISNNAYSTPVFLSLNNKLYFVYLNEKNQPMIFQSDDGISVSNNWLLNETTIPGGILLKKDGQKLLVFVQFNESSSHLYTLDNNVLYQDTFQSNGDFYPSTYGNYRLIIDALELNLPTSVQKTSTFTSWANWYGVSGITPNVMENVGSAYRCIASDFPIPTATLTMTPTATPAPLPTLTPNSTQTATSSPEQLIVNPSLSPAYSSGCDGNKNSWYSYNSLYGNAYLTLNITNTSVETYAARWYPYFPKAGRYKVEAYIPNHNIITWPCTSKAIIGDTSNAKYQIWHRDGKTTIPINQLPLANQFITLGTFAFDQGNGNGYYIKLANITTDTHFSKFLSVSVLRLTYIGP